jgi:hypothetical protein
VKIGPGSVLPAYPALVGTYNLPAI